VVISDNIFGASGPWPVSIGPQDGGTNSYLSDIVFERNRMHSDYGTQSLVLVNTSIGIEAGYTTVRNNIIDGTGSGDTYTGIRIWRRGIEPAPVANEIYNNTIYRFDNNQGAQIGVKVDSPATKTIVKNNVVSFPNSSGSSASIVNDSSDLVQQTNILCSSCGFVSPINANPLLRDYTPQDGAILDEGGIQEVPVFTDFFGRNRFNYGERDGGYDIGAVEN
jgi:hypothetical protein